VDHPHQPVGVGLDPSGELDPIGLVGLREEFGQALDRRDRDQQIVGEAREEGLAGKFQSVLLGQIAGDLRVAGQVTIVVVHRSDDHVTPEEVSILADPPAMVLNPTGLTGLGEQAVWKTIALVRDRVEHREVLADGLRSRVALESLCAVIP
jgi:hypothetical protein